MARRPPEQTATPPPPEVPSPPDPRLAYRGPFRNVHPSVKYVGDAACAGCHKPESDGFHDHPMSRSIVPVSRLAASQRYDAKAHNPFDALQYRFVVQRQGNRVWHEQERVSLQGRVLAALRVEAEFAVGSGRRGRSYFTTRGGLLFQTPISWYAQKDIWDLSPGFQKGELRPVLSECLFCHAGGARPVEEALNRYEEPIFRPAAISCERCHGPGELHVKARRAEERVRGRIDRTIVNPRHLPPDLREAVCQQCHLEGIARVPRRGRTLFEFRPGLSFDTFCATFVINPALPQLQQAVGQVEQMYQSKCFRASKGKLGCATCHDPHGAPPTGDRRMVYHREKCLACHEDEHRCSLEQAVRLRQSKEDSCIDCHMPRLPSADIVHTASTDHRIPRRRQPPSQGGPADRPRLPKDPLVPFPPRPGDDPEADRDLGIALVRVGQEKGEGAFRLYLPRALRLLRAAEARAPQDIPVLASLIPCLEMSGQLPEALSVCRKILSLNPRHELATVGAALLSMRLAKVDDALGYWEKALALNPWNPDAALFQAALLARKEKYQEAMAVCRKLLGQDPLRPEPWAILAHCQRRTGKEGQAEKDWQRAESLRTPAFDDFCGWFPDLVK